MDLDTVTNPPDPGTAGCLDDLIERLRMLKVWAGGPSYDWITRQVNRAWTTAGRPPAELARRSTVAHCFRPGRQRLNSDLVVAVVRSLHPDPAYLAQWRQALRVVGGETEAATQVRVQGALPDDVAGFTGRGAELARLRQVILAGGTVAVAGMAGVGKTSLAVHGGHRAIRERQFDRVLFVNLRGFHPDRAQPPADPAAVLDGFLRLLGMAGQHIPYGLPARVAAYREWLAGRRVLVVLDNAASEEQVEPLLPRTAGCPVLVTSRRTLAGLERVVDVPVDVFTPAEAEAYLTLAAPAVPVGSDPGAAARIAHRCGYLPLALGLMSAHMGGANGWTLTDHADRLDERHRDRRLDAGVEVALDLSYQHLPAGPRRMLRLAALHPDQEIDAYAAAALAETDVADARVLLAGLARHHLAQLGAPGRYTLHDLVRTFASARADDEDPPSARHAARTRLFDHYLAAAATAMDTLYPAESHRRPRIPASGTPLPELTEAEKARVWLSTERPTLVSVTAYAAGHGWHTHATLLSRTLFRYLAGGFHTDALAVHGCARDAARRAGDASGEAQELTNLGVAWLRLGEHETAATHFGQALELYDRLDDPLGHARTLSNLANVYGRTGRYGPAAAGHRQALGLYRRAGDQLGEIDTLSNLGVIELRLSRYASGAEHCEQALELARRIDDRAGEAWVLNCLGDCETRLGRHSAAAEHLGQALDLFREAGDRTGEHRTLDTLGILYTRLGRFSEARDHHRRALEFFQAAGDRDGEIWALNGLGDTANASGDPTAAVVHHTAALDAAVEIGDRQQQAQALAGLALAQGSLGATEVAEAHHRDSLAIYAELCR